MKRLLISSIAAATAAGLLVAGANSVAVADETSRGPASALVLTGKGPVRGGVAADHRILPGHPVRNRGEVLLAGTDGDVDGRSGRHHRRAGLRPGTG
jgi:hypothetical protein